MAKTRKQKEKEVKDLTENLGKVKSLVFVDFTNLTVSDLEDLRGRLREAGANLKVVKKSLLKIAWEKNKDLKKIKEIKEIGRPLSLAFGFEDEAAPAKILVDFKKTHPKFEILGGVFDHQYISQEEVVSLARLPQKEELRGKVVYLIASPLNGLVRVLAGNIRGLINILQSLKSKPY